MKPLHSRVDRSILSLDPVPVPPQIRGGLSRTGYSQERQAALIRFGLEEPSPSQRNVVSATARDPEPGEYKQCRNRDAAAQPAHLDGEARAHFFRSTFATVTNSQDHPQRGTDRHQRRHKRKTKPANAIVVLSRALGTQPQSAGMMRSNSNVLGAKLIRIEIGEDLFQLKRIGYEKGDRSAVTFRGTIKPVDSPVVHFDFRGAAMPIESHSPPAPERR